MKKNLVRGTLVLFCCALFIVLSGCDRGGAPAAAKQRHSREVPPRAAWELMQNKKDLLIIDVRSPHELRHGAIEHSRLIPLNDIFRQKFSLPQDRPLLLVCAVGGRSSAAAFVMAQMGFSELYNLQGGIAAWKQAGLPLEYPAVP